MSKIPQIQRCLSTFACIRKNKFVPKFYLIAYCFKMSNYTDKIRHAKSGKTWLYYSFLSNWLDHWTGNRKACSSRGLHSSGYPVETRICLAWRFARADVWRWRKSWRGIWHIDSNNYEWRSEQIPIQRKTKLEISVARLRLLSCFVWF